MLLDVPRSYGKPRQLFVRLVDSSGRLELILTTLGGSGQLWGGSEGGSGQLWGGSESGSGHLWAVTSSAGDAQFLRPASSPPADLR